MMRFRRSSFAFRLIVGAAVWICLGLAASWLALSWIIREHVMDEFREELYHHSTELSGLAGIDTAGHLALRQKLSDHRFFEIGSGYYWQLDRTNGDVVTSPSLGATTLPFNIEREENAPSVLSLVETPFGPLQLLQHVVRLERTGEIIRLGIAIDMRLVDKLLAKFDRTLALALGVIAAGLVAAVMVQVTFGLRPLSRIRTGLQDIRRGAANRLPEDLPTEVAPLAHSLNAMIQANDEVVLRARTQAGYLAHALQTPLSILMDEGRRLNALGQNGNVVLQESEKMRRQIEYQLAHARAVASRGRPYPHAKLADAISGIISAMSRLQYHCAVDFEQSDISNETLVACEAEDLDELLGNLIENATKWARSRVVVNVVPAEHGFVRIEIDDDGPGMPENAAEIVFTAGARLDEKVAGHGLGLAIVHDIATLYGGHITIGKADIGGAHVALTLPVVKSQP